MPKVEGPFEVLEMVNDNAYKIDMAHDLQVLTMFNATDLSLYKDNDCLTNLRSNFTKQVEDSGGPS